MKVEKDWAPAKHLISHTIPSEFESYVYDVSFMLIMYMSYNSSSLPSVKHNVATAVDHFNFPLDL